VTQRAIAAALVCSVLVIGACSADRVRPSPSPSAAPSAATTANAVLKPSVEITYPTTKSKVVAPNVLVALTVRSFRIVDRIGRAPKKDEGHVVFYLDVNTMPTKAHRSALTEDGKSHRMAGTSYQWKRVKPGRHVLGVQLVNNDDTPLDPPATDTLAITVRAG
jgi:hypothetical protein